MGDTYYPVGYAKKAYGAKGEMKISIQENYLEDLLRADVVFIEIQGKPAPFFIEYIRESNDILLKLEDIDTPEQVRTITSKDLLLPISRLSIPPDQQQMELKYKPYEGFLLIDTEEGEIGVIAEVQEFPQQEMAVLDYHGKQIFIPLHEKLIEKIDETRRTITLRLPEGLLSM